MKSPLVGTWKLLDYSFLHENGTLEKPWGTEVEGILIYSTEGYMSGNLMHRRRKRPEPQREVAGEIGERIRGSRNYIAYAGRYTMEGDTVTHHVEVSLFPNWIGLPQLRYYKLAGDKLVLSTPMTLVKGEKLVGQLTWKRVR